MAHEFLLSIQDLMNQNREEEAYSLLKSRVHEFREDFFFFYLKGSLETILGDYATACESFKQSIAINPHESQTYSDLGYLFFLRQMPKESQIFLERALAIAPGDIGVLERLGMLHCWQGKPTEARKYLEALVALNQTAHSAWYYLAEIEAAEGHWERATRYYAEARKSKDFRREALFGMARSLEHQARFREAVEEYESLIQEEEDQESLARILARIGFCHMRDGRLHQSRRAFERALQIKKDSKVIYGNLGALSLELGDLEQARFYLMEGLALGEDPELLIQLGVCQLRLSDAIKAEVSLKRAMGVADEEQAVRVHYLLGKAYLAQGRYELGRACFHKIISDTHVDVDCLLLYLEASEHTRYLEEDLKDLRKHSGNELASFHAIVLFLLSRHRQEEALIYAKQGTELFPEDSHLWFYKASTLAVLNQHQEALLALEVSIELEPAMAARAKNNPCFAGLRKWDQFLDLINISGRGW